MLLKRPRRSACSMTKTTILVLGLIILVSPSFLAYYFLLNVPQQVNDEDLVEYVPSESTDTSKGRFERTSKQDNSLNNPLDLCSKRYSSTGTSTSFHQQCCAPWTYNTDEWWSRNYNWTVSKENKTHTCFTKITDTEQLAFYSKVHTQQQQCDDQVQLSQISSGYAAALMAVARSFYASYQSHHAFQITLAHATANWNFSPKNTSHWAYCKTQDMNCFYLPLSPCPPEQGRNDAPRGNKPSSGKSLQEFQWLRQYAFRLRHIIRQHVQEYWTTQPIPIQDFVQQETHSNCTVIHVRRGDIAFGKGRRYAAVDEYLQAGQVQPGETVILLTDDTSAVEEVEKYLQSEQNWIYLDRPRTKGTTLGFEGFIPSQDPAFEVISILAELQLASHCQKLVHGKSGFVAVIAEAMSSPELVYLPIQLDKKQQPKMNPADRAQVYLKQIDEHYRERKANQFH